MHLEDPVLVVKGKNKGKKGTFVRNTAVSSYVILDGSRKEQRFLKSSVVPAIVDPPVQAPLAREHAVLARKERLRSLDDVKGAINSLKTQLHALLINKPR
jgi:ribosomal protein L24